MIPEIGHLALWFALALSAALGVLSLAGAHTASADITGFLGSSSNSGSTDTHRVRLAGRCAEHTSDPLAPPIIRDNFGIFEEREPCRFPCFKEGRRRIYRD